MRFTERPRRTGRTSLLAVSLALVMSACGSGLENANSTTTTAHVAQAQAADHSRPKHSRYILKDLGPSADRNSNVNGGSVVINEKGTVAGGADTSTPDLTCGSNSPVLSSPNCLITHASKWQGGVMTDLGALPGGNNSFATVLNSSGLIGGFSENGLLDPLTGLNACVATAWKHGAITDLGTLGGSFSLVLAVNDRGQLVGGAQNTITDPVYFGDLLGLPGAQWRATLWQDGAIQDLGTLGEGQEAFAFYINERGQVAGMSFTSTKPNPTTGIPTLAPFIWANGKMTDLGSLGGTSAIVSGINNRGQVTGWSNLAGDLTNHAFLWSRGKLHDLGTLGGTYSLGNSINDRGEVAGASKTANDEGFDAFLWRNGVMTDLGRVAGDCFSNAFSINSQTQVVGQSFCGDQDGHAFISENGDHVVDLNTLVSPGSGMKLVEGKFINDRGEIVGAALLPNGQEHAFLLIPRDRHDDDDLDDAASPSPDAAVAARQGATSASWSGLTAKTLEELRARDTQRYSHFGFAEARSAK